MMIGGDEARDVHRLGHWDYDLSYFAPVRFRIRRQWHRQRQQ